MNIHGNALTCYDMNFSTIKTAIVALKDRTGSSRQAIKKYLLANYKLTPGNHFDAQVNNAIKKGAEKGVFNLPKGISGSVKLAKPAAKKPSEAKSSTKKPAVKKAPAAKKTTTTKKAPAPKKSASTTTKATKTTKAKLTHSFFFLFLVQAKPTAADKKKVATAKKRQATAKKPAAKKAPATKKPAAKKAATTKATPKAKKTTTMKRAAPTKRTTKK
ncbi:hypothetical protein NQZ79_g8270 [Umbelopsis isabellina]|nr:hypothetical protein NQZ79_g8270 [Umbelopsis isabellina]